MCPQYAQTPKRAQHTCTPRACAPRAQSATLNAVGALGFTNLAVSLALGGLDGPATGALGLAAVFTVVVLQQFRRVERLDKFEKDLKGG